MKSSSLVNGRSGHRLLPLLLILLSLIGFTGVRFSCVRETYKESQKHLPDVSLAEG